MPDKSSTNSVILRGPVRVVYQFHDDEWRATALEFDIAGYGPDKVSAFGMLQELLHEYFYEVAVLLHEGKEVEFFNPSRAEEWNRADAVEEFNVQFVLRAPSTTIAERIAPKGLGRLIESINSLEEMDMRLIPA